MAKAKKKKKPVGRNRVPARWRKAVAASKRKPAVVAVKYLRTKGGMIRWQVAGAQRGLKISRPYASRQGARRAACKRFKGCKVVWAGQNGAAA